MQWGVGKVFSYLGYFMMGYAIRGRTENKKDNARGLGLILLGVSIQVATAVYVYFRNMVGIDLSVMGIHVLNWEYLHPSQVAASAFIFAGFSRLQLKKDFSWLAGYTYQIYLIHAMLWIVVHNTIMPRIYATVDVRIVIPICSVIVYCGSLGAAIVYKKLRNYVKQRLRKRLLHRGINS